MVVPHVGTWIEISRKTITREAGVVPHVGTWIEINWDQSDIDPIRRASRRHVDWNPLGKEVENATQSCLT